MPVPDSFVDDFLLYWALLAMALVRGLARRRVSVVGNFWVDLVRGTVRIFLPLAVLVAIVAGLWTGVLPTPGLSSGEGLTAITAKAPATGHHERSKDD